MFEVKSCLLGVGKLLYNFIIEIRNIHDKVLFNSIANVYNNIRYKKNTFLIQLKKT